MTHWTDRLTEIGACDEAVRWARDYPSIDAAWAACERADWMLWLATRVCRELGSPGHRRLVLAACAVAETALHHVPAGDDRPRRAIEAARAWARGAAGVSIDDVNSAASASAAYAAAADAAAASAAYAAASAAADAAYAAYSAFAAADAAGSAFAAGMRVMADLLRRDFYPVPPPVGSAT